MKIKKAVLIFFTAKIYTWAVAAVVAYIFWKTGYRGTFAAMLKNTTAGWDSWIYEGISKEGYNELFKCAFFPLMPLLTGVVAGLFHMDIYWAGVMLSNIFCLAALIYLYALTLELYGERIAVLSCVLFMTAPTAYAYNSYLTEPLFMLLTVMSFYYMRRKNWALAVVAAALAGATRNIGVFLLPPIVYEYCVSRLRHGEMKKKRGLFNRAALILSKLDIKIILLSLAALAGLAGFILYLYIKRNDPLAFVHGTRLWPERHLAHFPFKAFIGRVGQIKREFAIRVIDDRMNLEFLYFGGFTFLLAYGIKKIKTPLLLFAAGIYLLLATMERLTSFERYISSIFVVWILLAIFISERKHAAAWSAALISCSAIWQVYVCFRLALRLWVG